MKKLTIICFTLLAISLPTLMAQNLKTPEDFFGSNPGTDRFLIDYEELIEYLFYLDNESERLKMLNIGQSPMGKPMYICFISSKENISRLNELKIINRELSHNPDLTDSIKNSYIDQGRVYVLATLSMHSTEVGPSQAAPLIAHMLCKTMHNDTLEWLNKVVLMMIPCHNPDGMNMIVHHYRKNLGTLYESSSYPGVYHKYVGHDNNRDFITLSQEDTKNISRITSTDWFPQVMVEKHQMGMTGPRYFVPPNHDPIAENIDAGLWNWIGIFGSHMITDMTKAGHKGISQHYLFDNYWPGSTETCLWKNTIAFLTEAASVKTATPVYIEPGELKVYGKGLSEYKKSVNMPLPWEGGWWHLQDIVQYELSSLFSIMKTSARYKEEILSFRNDLCIKNIHMGRTSPPFFYHIPYQQHDISELNQMLKLLDEHGVEIYQVREAFKTNKGYAAKGDYIIPLAQVFRSFIKEVMEKQFFPERHYTPGGELIKPYDITSWSLPVHRGIEVFEINTNQDKLQDYIETATFDTYDKVPTSKNEWILLDAAFNSSYKICFKAMSNGSNAYLLSRYENGDSSDYFIIRNNNNNLTYISELDSNLFFFSDKPDIKALKEIGFPRIALVESFQHDMDAGWTRYVLDQYTIPYSILRPHEIVKKEKVSTFDVIILPDINKDILISGQRKSRDGNIYPSRYEPKYTKGMGNKGLSSLIDFVEEGGRIVSWGHSVSLFTNPVKTDSTQIFLPVKEITKDSEAKGLYIPGSMINIRFTGKYTFNRGMPDVISVFSRGRPVLETHVPGFGTDRKVLAYFTDKNTLSSGFAKNIELIENKPAICLVSKGKGEILLMAFQPQFRASCPISYKLLFNALINSK